MNLPKIADCAYVPTSSAVISNDVMCMNELKLTYLSYQCLDLLMSRLLDYSMKECPTTKYVFPYLCPKRGKIIYHVLSGKRNIS